MGTLPADGPARFRSPSVVHSGHVRGRTRGRHGGAALITASADDLTVAPVANGEATLITAPTDDLTADVTVVPDASGVGGARHQSAGEEAGAQHTRTRGGTTAIGLGA